MRDKSQLGSVEARYFTDNVRVIAWSVVDKYEPDDVIEIGSSDIASGPCHAFWCVQESVASFKFTQKVYVEAAKQGMTVIFHRMDIDVSHLCVPIPDSPKEGLVSDVIADAIRLLAMDEVVSGLDALICDRLVRYFEGQNIVVSRRSRLQDWFLLDPCRVGDAVFEVLPGLQVLVWRAPPAVSKTARFVAIRNITESVTSVTHFVGGLGLRNNAWFIPLSSSIHY